MITNIIKNIIKDIPSVANSKFDSVQLLPIGNKVELKEKKRKRTISMNMQRSSQRHWLTWGNNFLGLAFIF